MLLKKYNIKNSTLFWNSIPITAQIILAFFSFQAFVCVQMLLFLFCIFASIEHKNPPFFLYFTFPTLVLFGFVHSILFVGKVTSWLLDNPVQKFNDWMDIEREKKEEEKKLNFTEFKDTINK